LQERTRFGELGFDSAAFGVAEVDADSGLTGVTGLAGDSAEEFGSGSHGLAVALANHQSGIEAPRVVDLDDEMCGHLVAVEVLRGEPGPTPLVFEFVEWVFILASFAVKGDEDGGP